MDLTFLGYGVEQDSIGATAVLFALAEVRTR